jgi:hypothetical protein
LQGIRRAIVRTLTLSVDSLKCRLAFERIPSVYARQEKPLRDEVWASSTNDGKALRRREGYACRKHPARSRRSR